VYFIFNLISIEITIISLFY